MNQMKVFQNQDFGEIRTVMQDDVPWFVGTDVAKALGYNEPHKAVQRHVDEDDGMKCPIIDSMGREQRATVINESGLYSLILSSKLESAKKFKRWVTCEVLPSIRKHGAYMTETTLEKALTSPEFLIKLATQLKDEQEQRRALENQIRDDQPFTQFAKAIAHSSDSISVGAFAKLCQNDGLITGRNRLFAWLRNSGFLIKKGRDKNVPKQQYVEQGLFEVKESTQHTVKGDLITKTTLITGKGQLYFLEKLRLAKIA